MTHSQPLTTSSAFCWVTAVCFHISTPHPFLATNGVSPRTTVLVFGVGRAIGAGIVVFNESSSINAAASATVDSLPLLFHMVIDCSSS